MAFEAEKLISVERKNLRDVHWCGLINEPVILTYPNGVPHCSVCEGDAESVDDKVFLMTHPFLFHINRYNGEDK